MRVYSARLNKGFTLLELVIVVAIVAALAVGLLAALDPLEQINKGNDTATNNVMKQIYDASIRFFSIRRFMPWCATATECLNPTGTALDVAPMAGDPTVAGGGAIANMQNNRELRPNFLVNYARIAPQIIVTGTATTVRVCYQPTSRTFQTESANFANRQGTVGCTQNPRLTCWACIF